MRVYFWGTRGSLPNSITTKNIQDKLKKSLIKSLQYNLQNEKDVKDFINNKLTFSEKGTFGSNTSCVELRDDELDKKRNEFVICDCGSGLRDFGSFIMQNKKNGTFHIFVSHFHWDHIQGFPFFTPAFLAKNTINIYGCHKELQEAFVNQQLKRHFPISLSKMGAKINFITMKAGEEFEVAGYKINIILQDHPGDSYGYSFEKNGKKIVYSTDSEHSQNASNPDYPFIEFFKNADLLIFDAQYFFLDNLVSKKKWGHSNSLVGVDLASKSNVKKLYLFHSEHTYDDETIEKMLFVARKYARIAKIENLQIEFASDGLEITV